MYIFMKEWTEFKKQFKKTAKQGGKVVTCGAKLYWKKSKQELGKGYEKRKKLKSPLTGLTGWGRF